MVTRVRTVSPAVPALYLIISRMGFGYNSFPAFVGFCVKSRCRSGSYSRSIIGLRTVEHGILAIFGGRKMAFVFCTSFGRQSQEIHMFETLPVTELNETAGHRQSRLCE